MVTLFGNLESGNVHKVQLILGRASIEYRRVEVSQAAGHTRTPQFLALNPMGKVPAVKLEDGDVLTESGALLYWFGRRTELWPAVARERTEVLRWMFFEQYSHEPTLAVMRYLRRTAAPEPEQVARQRELEPRALGALGVMEARLATSAWLAGRSCSLADLALYPYTKWADEAGIDLSPYSHIEGWLARVEGQPRFVKLRTEGAREVIPFDTYFR
jgi:glutathione S-transferase